VRLRIDAARARRRPLLILSLGLCLATMLSAAQADQDQNQEQEQNQAQDQTQDQIEADRPLVSDAEANRAIVAVKKDKNLTAEQTVKSLRWKNKKSTRPSGNVGWLVGLIRWINQSARLLVWIAAAVLIGVLFVYFLRLVGRHRRKGATDGDFIAPTHVRDLDIRPETLPSDIGAAARRLWDDGEQRAALALLYRGLLSRLAHVHRVPIRDSSTEGDCLALAARHLTQRRRDYASSLVKVWQRAVYGREDVQTVTIHSLCDDFGAALDARDPIEAGGVA
jgi:hypothetical protein